MNTAIPCHLPLDIIFENIITFLQENNWLYDFPMIKVFLLDVINKLPEEWKSWFEKDANAIYKLTGQTYESVDCPSLKSFLLQCNALTLASLMKLKCSYLSFQAVQNDSQPQTSIKREFLFKEETSKEAEEEEVNSYFLREFQVKKRHEVKYLGDFISKVNQISKSTQILDVGSGLGYLDLYLHKKYKHKVIGAESSSDNIKKAERMKSICIGNCPCVQFIEWKLEDTEDIVDKSKEIIAKFYPLFNPCTDNRITTTHDKCPSSNQPRNDCAKLYQSHNISLKGRRVDEDKATRNVMFKNQYNRSDMSDDIWPTNISPDESVHEHLNGRNCSRFDSSEMIPKTDSFECNCMAIHPPSGKSVKSHLSENDAKTDLVSLHSCGDLSPIMLKLFVKNKQISSVISLSCCYHKMSTSPECDHHTCKTDCKHTCSFKYFPLSNTLDRIIKKKKFKVNVFALRLASEEPLSHWSNRSSSLEKDIRSIAYRSILESLCEKSKMQLKKLKRRCVRTSAYNTFEEYVNLATTNYEFTDVKGERIEDSGWIRASLREEYHLVEKLVPLIGLIRAVQLHLQPVLESLILLDRVMYLKEEGFPCSGVAELFDEKMSPRNKAVFAFRKS